MKIHSFTVVPSLPEPLKRLEELAYNLYWCWSPTALGLFQRLDADLWKETYHNPVKMLGNISQKRIEEVLHDDGFMSHLDNAWEIFQNYINGPNWFNQTYGSKEAISIAYFSFEFGIAESVAIYSGGLGMLAGDHLKASSDLGLPLVGVSLLYHEGYFQQYLNKDGWQQEVYPENDFYNMPIKRMMDDKGEPMKIQVPLPDRAVTAQLWKMHVGRNELLFLDANLPENREEDRDITAQLYGGDTNMRIKQEMLMGIGGIRALKAAGYTPDIYHMNEGHSAFLSLERCRLYMEEYQVDFNTAFEAVRSSNVFTTHTPVAAGNDMFDAGMVRHYFQPYLQNEMQIDMEDFIRLGRINPTDKNESFNMTVFALNFASCSNGVSQLHGDVSRKMWQKVWPGVPLEEIPIGAITNGVHTRVWASLEMGNLFDRYIGPVWAENPASQGVWNRADEIPDSELWRTHERRRERLVGFARRRLRRQLEQRGATESELAQADEVLDPEALTIGFARRFALYKRGTLLMRDKQRLKELLSDKDRPVQIIFAGKAHPNDTMAKEIIRDLVHFMRDPEVRRHIVFLENYDMNVARYMLQGVDVWLNTPRRPLEASGTSGMKAAANGGLNLSILDGWWCEGYNEETGWSIGNGEEYDDLEKQDSIESAALYDLLEKEVIPSFYERAADRVPRTWVRHMKAAIRELCAGFNANRMVHDYIEGPYRCAAHAGVSMKANNLAGAREFSEWKNRVRQEWPKIGLASMEAPTDTETRVDDKLPVKAVFNLGDLQPDEVRVEAYYGQLNYKNEIQGGATLLLDFKESQEGKHVFEGAVPCESSGRMGFALRVLPRHEAMVSPFEMKLIHWAQ